MKTSMNGYELIKKYGGYREFAKLLLNNLYGKLASSTDSDYKEFIYADTDSIHTESEE